ncbi:hypothetical protein tb265_46990 [Gemmatimonadetes bacterium T265]|nr:hypothetical protein tb265_46990 [Gemmatimonadetes bacterium T265]
MVERALVQSTGLRLAGPLLSGVFTGIFAGKFACYTHAYVAAGERRRQVA